MTMTRRAVLMTSAAIAANVVRPELSFAQETPRKGGVFTVAYRPDGKQVATAGFDGVIRLNDPTTGKLIKEFVTVPVNDKK